MEGIHRNPGQGLQKILFCKPGKGRSIPLRYPGLQCTVVRTRLRRRRRSSLRYLACRRSTLPALHAPLLAHRGRPQRYFLSILDKVLFPLSPAPSERAPRPRPLIPPEAHIPSSPSSSPSDPLLPSPHSLPGPPPQTPSPLSTPRSPRRRSSPPPAFSFVSLPLFLCAHSPHTRSALHTPPFPGPRTKRALRVRISLLFVSRFAAFPLRRTLAISFSGQAVFEAPPAHRAPPAFN